MRIALVVTGGLHPSGRHQVIPALLEYVQRLAERHEVHAFVVRHLSEPQHYRLGSAHIHDLGRPQGRWAQWRALTRSAASYGPFDAIHGYWVDPAGVLAALLGRRLRVPSVVTCSSGEFVSIPSLDYGLQRSFLGRQLVSLACRQATIVHVTSEYMQRLARHHGITAERIPFGIPLERFSTNTERADGPPWRLLQVASLNPVKQHTILLQALARLRRTLDVRLDVVGEDTMSGALQRESRALGVDDAVRFHGFVAQEDIAAHYDHAHVYVQSSRHEAAGIAVLEAAASGLPIVGTRVGFVSDWHGISALGVAPGDADALAAALELVLRDPERRTALGRAARLRAAEYDVVDTTARFEKLLSNLRPR